MTDRDRELDRDGTKTNVNKPPDGGNINTPVREVCSGDSNFSGFRKEDMELPNKMCYRRVLALEQVVNELMEKIDKMEERQMILQEDNRHFKLQCERYEKILMKYEEKVEVNTEKVKVLSEKQNQWKVEREEEKASFKEILEQEIKNKTERSVEKSVVKVIKEKEGLVRDTVEKKKCVVMFGVKEKVQPIWHIREKEEKTVAVGLVKEAQIEGSSVHEEIEEVVRIGKYTEGGQRPLKVKFRSQVAAEEIIAGAWKLSKKEETKNVWIRRDLNEEERAKMTELWEEAKAKNESRTEAEKKKFRWKVMDMRLRKWYFRMRETEGSN